jgi:hypothetical protein
MIAVDGRVRCSAECSRNLTCKVIFPHWAVNLLQQILAIVDVSFVDVLKEEMFLWS